MFPLPSNRITLGAVAAGLTRPLRHLSFLSALLLGGLSLNSCSTADKDSVQPTAAPVAEAAAKPYVTDFNKARGVNIQFAYYNEEYKRPDFKLIRKEGFTAVRIEVDPTRVDIDSDNDNLIGFGRVLRFVREARQAGLDVVLTYHDQKYMGANGSDNGARAAGDWWAKAIPKLKKNGYAYTINVINEWGRDTRNGKNQDFVQKWVSGYNYAIDKIHAAGYEGPIIIDASNYAQDVELLLSRGKDISTNGHRIFFSVHIYPDAGITVKNLVDLNAKYDGTNYNYGMIVGEFGSQYDQGRKENKDLVRGLVQNALGKGFGTFGWAWLGDRDGSSKYMNAETNSNYRSWLKSTMKL